MTFISHLWSVFDLSTCFASFCHTNTWVEVHQSWELGNCSRSHTLAAFWGSVTAGQSEDDPLLNTTGSQFPAVKSTIFASTSQKKAHLSRMHDGTMLTLSFTCSSGANISVNFYTSLRTGVFAQKLAELLTSTGYSVTVRRLCTCVCFLMCWFLKFPSFHSELKCPGRNPQGSSAAAFISVKPSKNNQHQQCVNESGRRPAGMAGRRWWSWRPLQTSHQQ